MCAFEGHRNTRAVLVPWDKHGYVLLCKNRQIVLILRTKLLPRPRVFKSLNTAIGICRQIGFTSVTIQLASEHFDFPRPDSNKDDTDE